ncbi:uncharacterized protein [Diadema antillarum]|uniref:uncharacterized protein n=1 Tax=Diadema antillarum TaxID=105358 RepID=UPI003A853C0E
MAWKSKSVLEIYLLLLLQDIMLCIVTAEKPSLSCLYDHEDIYLSKASTCLGCFSVSCYRDHYIFEDENMTIVTCVNECEKRGSQYAGLIYGHMCSCGVLECNETSRVPVQSCGMPCRGNLAMFCGGFYYFSVYSVNDNSTTEKTSEEYQSATDKGTTKLTSGKNSSAQDGISTTNISWNYLRDLTTEIESPTDLTLTSSSSASLEVTTYLHESEKPVSSVNKNTDKPSVIALTVAVVLLFVLLLLFVMRYEWLRSRGSSGNSVSRGKAVGAESVDVQMTTHDAYQALHAAPKLSAKTDTNESLESSVPSAKVSTPYRQPAAIVDPASFFQNAEQEYEEMQFVSVVDPGCPESESEAYGICIPGVGDTYSTTWPQLEPNEITYQNCRRDIVL